MHPHTLSLAWSLWQALTICMLALVFRFFVFSCSFFKRITCQHITFSCVSSFYYIFATKCLATTPSLCPHCSCPPPFSLLVATAAPRPALLAPNTHAPAILLSLRLGEGLNQLYQYCQTIANYGNQGLALDTTAIKTLKNIRTERNMVLASLDREAVKYITNPDILSIIEKDKDILRDLPEKIDFSKIKKAQDLLKIEFPELSVNYEKKYNDLRKKQREKKAT